MAKCHLIYMCHKSLWWLLQALFVSQMNVTFLTAAAPANVDATHHCELTLRNHTFVFVAGAHHSKLPGNP